MVRFTKPQLKIFEILKFFYECSTYDEFSVSSVCMMNFLSSNRCGLKKNGINGLINGLYRIALQPTPTYSRSLQPNPGHSRLLQPTPGHSDQLKPL